MACGVKGGDGREVGVGTELVGEVVDGQSTRSAQPVTYLEPQILVLAVVQQPSAECGSFLLFPRIGCPAALALGALDQGDVLAAGDQVDAGLNDLAVPVRPVSGDLGDGGRAVAREPGGLDLPGLGLPREHDLESALAEVDFGDGFGVG